MQPLMVRVPVALRSRTLGLETPAPFETFGEDGGNIHHHWADGSACCCATFGVMGVSEHRP